VAAEYASSVRRARRYAGPELVRLVNLQLEWTLDDVVAAMRHARDYGCFEARAVQRILEARFTPRCFEQLMAAATRRRIQEVMKEHPIGRRPRESYVSLREGDRPVASDREEPHENPAQERGRADGGSDVGADPGRTGGAAPPADAPDAR